MGLADGHRLHLAASVVGDGRGMGRAASQLTEIHAPVADSMRRVVEIIDDELHSELPFVNELCGIVRGYRGKMLRPVMLLLTGKALGRLSPEHETLAAVVEMVHMATLVHDDVLDEADVRRRAPTVNAMSSNETAVMLGDYLISHAYHLCSSVESQEASRLVAHATNVVCEGELMQIDSRGRFDLTEAEYIEIVRRKTAALTGVACALGARWSGASPEDVDAMLGFGESAGIAFQIVDDVLDIVGNEDRMGKTLGRDLDLQKPTLPVIHGLASAPDDVRAMLADGDAPPSDVARADVAAVLRECGSVAYALDVAGSYVTRALHALDRLPDSDARSALLAMAEFIMQRDV